jgi:hypothetical protein
LVLVGGDNGSTVTAIQVDGSGYTKAILQANTGVDIGDVDVTSIVPGTGATNLGKAEDVAHSTGDTGVMALAVRDDNLAPFSGAEGDYEPLHTDGSGRLYVTMDEVVSGSEMQVDVVAALPAGTNAIGKLAANSGVDIGDVDVLSLPSGNLGQQAMAASLSTVPASNITDATYIGDIKFGEALPTGANTIGVVSLTGNALTALQLIDDAVYVDDADWTDNTSKHLLVGGLYQSSPQTITDGDVGPLEVDANGYLKVSLEANPAGVAGSTAYTEDAASANPIVGTATMMERDDQLGALTPVEGDWVSLRSTSKGALWVSLADASGDPITAFGGGTEYTEDVATANPQVGKAIMVERDDALAGVSPAEGDWMGLRGSAEGALWVQDFNSDAILADTTAILADTAAIQTAVELLDNAVDGNYLNVNLNAAGTDVTAGAGAVGASTQRVTLASDDPAVAKLGTIDTDTGAMATSLGNLDNAVDGNYLNVNMNIAGTDAAVGGGTEATAMRVTMANDSTGLVSVDDGGGSLTVDGNLGDNGPGFTPIYKYLAKSTTADATLWDPAAGKAIVLTDVIISISGTATDVNLAFGAGTTLTTQCLKFHGDVRGGLTHHFRSPIKGGTDENLNIDLSAAQAMTITVCGYEE